MSTGIAAIVVQFGLAMIPLRALAISPPLTSLTTSGTSGSIRHADELSITIDAGGGELRRQLSRRRGAGREQGDVEAGRIGQLAASSTVISLPFHGRVVPAERAEAK